MSVYKTIGVLAVLLTSLTGCSSTTEKMDKRLTGEARIYSKAKAIYCGASDVKSYYEEEGFITVSCADGSTKTIFLD